MKLLSVIVPCYQSQDYMEHALKTLLTGGEEVEILVIDDGSSDRTFEIAQLYEKEHPSIFKAVHQENKGHGGALNTGIDLASGLYLKVVDSDDWVNAEAFKEILCTIRQMVQEKEMADLLLSNFVYEKQGVERKKIIHYRRCISEGRNYGWNEIHGFPVTNYLMMHSMIYRTQIVKESRLKLPEHTFYVDHLFVFEPILRVKTLRYVDVNFYRYFIGREDQSVQESVMIKRMDQHYRVTRSMIDYMHKNLSEMQERSLRKTMYTNLRLVMAIASVLAILEGGERGRQKKKELWRYLMKLDKKMYRKIRFGSVGFFVNMPGIPGRKAALLGYHILQRLYGFN